MRKEEIYKELTLPYQDLVKYLLQKYGGAVSDYFCNSECRSKSKKITRTKEGLYCHHIDEDKGGNLSDSMSAKEQPYEWQKKDRLVYCNVLEHLILHIKIAVMRQKKRLQKLTDIEMFFTTGGIFQLCAELNDMFSKNGTSVPWKQRCFEEVRDNYAEYMILLKLMMWYLQEQYVGEKQNFDKVMNGIAHNLSSGYYDFYDEICTEVLRYNEEFTLPELSKNLLVDFHGYGFPEYTDCYIDKEQYGSMNVDEYISKAYPATVESTYKMNKQIPTFWKGNIPKKILKNDTFFIVRVNASFSIKDGNVPFVRYKKKDMLRMVFENKITEDNNFLCKKGTVLGTSDVFDKRTGRYYSKYIDENNKVVDACVELTFTKEDFFLFQEKHEIRKMKILDGCYFQ